MEMSVKLTFFLAVLSMLLRCSPTEAWYKQVTAGPSYYSVGRASGLLSGFRRFPNLRRAERDSSEEGREPLGNTHTAQHNFGSLNFFFNTPICIKDITPNLQSCELDRSVKGLFKCKADVLLSLDATDCAEY